MCKDHLNGWNPCSTKLLFFSEDLENLHHNIWGPTINKFFPKPNNQKTQLTKYSSVNPTSKIDFAPAQTTATGVLPSSVKSALMSNAAKI